VLQARADSLGAEAQRLLTRLETELASVRDALRQSQAEVTRLRTELAHAGTSGNAGAVARLRAALDVAETRQRALARAVAMGYRAAIRWPSSATRWARISLWSTSARAASSPTPRSRSARSARRWPTSCRSTGTGRRGHRGARSSIAPAVWRRCCTAAIGSRRER